MALDLYVGPVSRYVVGDWQNVGQQMAEANGLKHQAVGPGARRPAGFFGRRRAENAYAAWREKMRKFMLAQGEPTPLWDDSATLDYATDRPGWEGLLGLVLKYATLLHPQYPPPSGPMGEIDIEVENAYLDTLSRPGLIHALADVPVWLPGRFDTIYAMPLVDGPALNTASLGALSATLDQVCELWGKERALMATLQTDQPGSKASLDEAALHGLAVLCRLTDEATRRNLPMIVDA